MDPHPNSTQNEKGGRRFRRQTDKNHTPGLSTELLSSFNVFSFYNNFNTVLCLGVLCEGYTQQGVSISHSSRVSTATTNTTFSSRSLGGGGEKEQRKRFQPLCPPEDKPPPGERGLTCFSCPAPLVLEKLRSFQLGRKKYIYKALKVVKNILLSPPKKSTSPKHTAQKS